jgi:hypothetical protein
MINYLDHAKWEFLRLIIKDTDNSDIPFLIGAESSDYLEKAKKYFQSGDVPAAALYTRIEFERVVIKYAEGKEIQVRFRRKTQEIPISEIWNKVKPQISEGKEIISKIDIYKSILLNPAVHYDARPKYRNEVENAIEVVESLRKILGES